MLSGCQLPLPVDLYTHSLSAEPPPEPLAEIKVRGRPFPKGLLQNTDPHGMHWVKKVLLNV